MPRPGLCWAPLTSRWTKQTQPFLSWDRLWNPTPTPRQGEIPSPPRGLRGHGQVTAFPSPPFLICKVGAMVVSTS